MAALCAVGLESTHMRGFGGCCEEQHLLMFTQWHLDVQGCGARHHPVINTDAIVYENSAAQARLSAMPAANSFDCHT